jgi:hypothetical protein
MRAGRVNGRGDYHHDSAGGNRRCTWTTKTQTELTNNGTLVGLSDGIQMDLPKQQWQFHRECGENTLAPHRGQLCCPLVAALPPPLFTFFIQEAHLLGGNRGIQKCDYVDPLGLVINCLGGGGTSWGTW